MRPRSFGEILDGAFQIFRRHFLVLGLTTVVPFGVMGLGNGLIAASSGSGGDPTLALAGLPVMLIAVLLMVPLWGALAWQTSEAWIGGPVTLGDGARAGARSFFRLLGASILMYALLWVVMIVVLIPIGIVMAITIPAAAGGGESAAVLIGGLMGLAMVVGMVVGGFLGGGVMACALPAVVVEGLGPIRALGRSFELSRGAILRNGALVFVSFVIAFLPSMGVALITGQFAGMMDPNAAPPSAGTIFIQQLGSTAVAAFTAPFMAAVISVMYYDRRVRTEALDVQLAAQQMEAAEPVVG